MAFLKEKPHFYTALLLFLTGLEGLLWLGLFLPQVKEVSRGGGVVGPGVEEVGRRPQAARAFSTFQAWAKASAICSAGRAPENSR